jgi:hypothetical protein
MLLIDNLLALIISKLFHREASVPGIRVVLIDAIASRENLRNMSVWATQVHGAQRERGELAMRLHVAHVSQRPLGQPGLLCP